MPQLVRLRLAAFERQNGCCYYCTLPMWMSNPHAFATRYGLGQRTASLLQCTAEHLQPRSEGGKDDPDNIVAACHLCNLRRHQRGKNPSAEMFRARVQTRISRSKWFPTDTASIRRSVTKSVIAEDVSLQTRKDRITPASGDLKAKPIQAELLDGISLTERWR